MNNPIQILSLGAGVQSSTLALMAAAGEITPMPDAAIFADTQAEPASVYEWLDWLEKQLPYPVLRVTKGSLSDSALAVRTSKGGKKYTNSNVPAFLKTEGVDREGLQMRQCTKDFKIDVILRKVRSLISGSEMKAWRRNHSDSLKLWRGHQIEQATARREKRHNPVAFPTKAWMAMQADPLVIQWIGISRDEVYRQKPSRIPYIAHRWHLIDRNITRSACIKWMESRGFPEPPRSACVFCPYHGDAEWLRLKETEPSEFERAASFEDSYQGSLAQIQRRSAVPFLHRSMIPLRQIDFAALVKNKADIASRQPDLFGNECEGICGV